MDVHIFLPFRKGYDTEKWWVSRFSPIIPCKLGVHNLFLNPKSPLLPLRLRNV
jgi:hypothetical protein